MKFLNMKTLTYDDCFWKTIKVSLMTQINNVLGAAQDLSEVAQIDLVLSFQIFLAKKKQKQFIKNNKAKPR